MTNTDYSGKLEELDRLLNDPDVALEPDRIWSLLAEISQHDVVAAGLPHGPAGRPIATALAAAP